MDIRSYNRDAWDKSVADKNEWTLPVSSEAVAAARAGDWQIRLTRSKPVPLQWFPPLDHLPVLCLAGGGGQQGPILAAAGARVTVFDNSPRQLAQDRRVAKRDGLEIEMVEGDMRDLSAFSSGQFGLIVHPVSNLFVPEVRPVWEESFRVLRPGGILMAGFMNPAFYIFDRVKMDDEGVFTVRHSLPYSDLTSISPEEQQQIIDAGWPLEFGHTLEDQIGGQLEAGFILTGFYEDIDTRNILHQYMPAHLATRALRPAG